MARSSVGYRSESGRNENWDKFFQKNLSNWLQFPRDRGTVEVGKTFLIKRLEKRAMTTQEQARQLMAEERQEAEHLQESMLERAAEEVQTPPTGELDEQARELLARERQEAEQLRESMLERASENAKKPNNCGSPC